jgi:hypothetical protein
MNGRKAKQIRKKSIGFLIDWLKTMLVEEEQKKVSVENYKNYLPEQTHIYANKKLMVSSFTPRWFQKKIKHLLKRKPIDKITYNDII